MPYIKVHIHFVWSTKNWIPFLNSPEIRKQFWQHIHKNGKEKEIYIDTVNGYHDHCHCLVSLGNDQNLKTVAQMIKGESSFWINHQQRDALLKQKFEWQDDYFAVAVSESLVPAVRQYIKNQEEHHRTISFQEEYQSFLKENGFEKLKR